MEQNNTLFARKRSDLEGRERGRIRGWKTESPSAKKKQRGNRRPGDSRGFRWIAEDRRSTMEREQEEETRAKLGRNRTILHISQSKRERDRDRDKDRERSCVERGGKQRKQREREREREIMCRL